MGKIVKHNQPCIGCSSSNAMQVYEDGGAKCYSCGVSFSKEKVARGSVEPQASEPKSESFTPQKFSIPRMGASALGPRKFTKESIRDLPMAGFPARDITRQVAEFYGVKVSRSGEEIDYHFYPYEKAGTYKVRQVADKKFWWHGPKSKKLFGQDKFEPGGQRVVLVEGEMDVLAMQQANVDKSKKFYPVVGVPSSSDLEAVIEQREWLRSFKQVVVFMDNDEAGQKALKQILRIVGYDKCRIMQIEENDINDQLLTEGGANTLVSAMFNAIEYQPAGIVGRDAIRKAIIERAATPSHPYSPCLSSLNKKLVGKRGGEIVLFVSGTGCGKSTMFREEILNVIQTTKSKVGVVSLEEAVGETGQKLAAMNLNINPASSELGLEQVLASVDQVFEVDAEGQDRVMVLDHQGAITDGTIMDQLEYMCLKGAEFIFIDHITILVSEGVDGLTGNEAQDKVMNDLLRLVKKYPNVWIGLISHLRKAPSQGKSFEAGKMPSIDDIRGSGSVKQNSFDIVAFARDTTSDDPDVRCTVDFMVLKCRWNGETGPAGNAFYDKATGRMRQGSEFTKAPAPAPAPEQFKPVMHGKSSNVSPAF